VEVWALQTARTDYGWAVDHQLYNPTNGWALRFSPAQISLERTLDGQFAPIQTQIPLEKDTYQHVVATFDGTTGVLYVDGNPVQTRPSSPSLKPMTSSSWMAGAQNCGCKSSNFIGSLDELAVYDRALGPERVLSHYRASGR
jgi:hypothetical protein